MHARRVDLQSQADRVAAALKEWDPEGLSETCRMAEAESEAAIADVRRRMGQVAEPEQPSNLAEARAWFGREETALASLESGEVGFKTARDSLREKLDDLEREVRETSTAIGLEKQELIKLIAQLDLLAENNGTDEVRGRALFEARTAKDEAETRLAETRTAVAALQPDLLEADRGRLQRAWTETEDQSRQASTDRAVAQERLRSDGSDDPVTALSRAETELQSATEHFDAVSRKARAIAHVDALFLQEQHALADQFSQPLAQAIGGYLQCLFGPEAQAVGPSRTTASRASGWPVRPMRVPSRSTASAGARRNRWRLRSAWPSPNCWPRIMTARSPLSSTTHSPTPTPSGSARSTHARPWRVAGVADHHRDLQPVGLRLSRRAPDDPVADALWGGCPRLGARAWRGGRPCAALGWDRRPPRTP